MGLFHASQRSCNVVRGLEAQDKVVTLALDLSIGSGLRGKVGHSSTEDSGIGILEGLRSGGIHLCTRLHIDAANAWMEGPHLYGASHEGHLGTTGSTLLSESKAHLA